MRRTVRQTKMHCAFQHLQNAQSCLTFDAQNETHCALFFLLLSTRKTLFERENAFVVPVATALQTPSPVRIARPPIKKCERKHGVDKDGVRVVEKC